MGKRKKHALVENQSTREHLYEVAIERFQKRGFDETSMRELAQAAGLSLGAFYYHFRTKDEVIQTYYESTFTVFKEGTERISREVPKFESRLMATLRYRIETFQERRPLLIALSRSAVNPHSSLSPFSKDQKKIREQTIEVFRELIAQSDLVAHARLKPVLPSILWMYMMGIILFWIYDESPRQRKTFELIDKLTPLIVRGIRWSRLPLAGRVIRPLIEVVEMVSAPQSAQARDHAPNDIDG